MRIVALIRNPCAVNALRCTLRREPRIRQRCSLSFLASWRELLDHETGRSFDAVFVQPDFAKVRGSSTGVDLELEVLLSTAGTHRIIPYVCSNPPSPGVLRELGEMGFIFVLVRGVDDDPGSLLRLLARVDSWQAIHPGARSEDQCGASLPRREILRGILGWPPQPSVGQVAESMHISPRTLRRMMRKVTDLSPKEAMRWGRLLEAISLWNLGIHSQARIAGVLEMGGPSNLGRLCRELTGQSLTSLIRSPDGHHHAASVFKELAS